MRLSEATCTFSVPYSIHWGISSPSLSRHPQLPFPSCGYSVRFPEETLHFTSPGSIFTYNAPFRGIPIDSWDFDWSHYRTSSCLGSVWFDRHLKSPSTAA